MKVFRSEPILFEHFDKVVVIYIANTFKDIMDEYNFPNTGTEDDDILGLMLPANGCINILLTNESSRRVILHECVHAINAIYEQIYATMDVSNDEVYAWQVSWLQDKVLDIHYENKMKSLLRND